MFSVSRFICVKVSCTLFVPLMRLAFHSFQFSCQKRYYPSAALVNSPFFDEIRKNKFALNNLHSLLKLEFTHIRCGARRQFIDWIGSFSPAWFGEAVVSEFYPFAGSQ